jgi:ElaB/YqjD/DUF883 family membrane-anchored ribosome-binding protein
LLIKLLIFSGVENMDTVEITNMNPEKVDAAAASAQGAADQVKQAANSAQSAANQVKDAVKTTVNIVAEKAKGAKDAAADAAAKGDVRGAAHTLGSDVHKVGTDLKDLGSAVAGAAGDAATNAKDRVTDTAGHAKEEVKGAAASVNKAAHNVAGAIVEKKDAVVEAVKGAAASVNDAAYNVVDAVAAKKDAAVQAVENAREEGGVRNAAHTLGSDVHKIGTDLKGLGAAVVGAAVDAAINTKDATVGAAVQVKEGVEGAASAVGSAIGSVGHAAASKVSDAKDAVTSIPSNIKSAIHKASAPLAQKEGIEGLPQKVQYDIHSNLEHKSATEETIIVITHSMTFRALGDKLTKEPAVERVSMDITDPHAGNSKHFAYSYNDFFKFDSDSELKLVGEDDNSPSAGGL